MPLPSVLLHEHLDGGLRPSTVIDLAAEAGHALPTTDEASLALFFDQRRSGSLETYLQAFTHTLAVMQTETALARVASESVEDLAAQGVVYAEIRFAPLLCTAGGLRGEQVVETALAALTDAGESHGLAWGLILDAIRSDADSEEVARLAIRYQDRGVVGFDLAGPEAGFPPQLHLPAIKLVLEAGLGLTLHAGEAGGLPSLASALRAGAQRIGHGVEVVADCRVEEGEILALGRLASSIRDRRIPLEVCPTSNLATKRWEPDEHPVGMLRRAGFSVTINTDNRLMSATSMRQEFEMVAASHGFTVDDLADVTRRALESAFCSEPLRKRLWEEQIAPSYAAEGAAVSLRW